MLKGWMLVEKQVQSCIDGVPVKIESFPAYDTILVCGPSLFLAIIIIVIPVLSTALGAVIYRDMVICANTTDVRSA
jgi:hypothetical protein